MNSKLSESEFKDSFDDLFLVYENVLFANFYEKDSLVVSTVEKERIMPFKSFYYVQNDTISINGACGLFGGFRFSIEFVEDKRELGELAQRKTVVKFSLDSSAIGMKNPIHGLRELWQNRAER
ncbi:MAG: hypothetical protein WBG90_16405 [Saonia sp.]